MPLYSDEALTLRHHDFGEADRIVSFFSRRHGKIRAVAKGARKLKSRFAGRLEPFHTVDITYYGREGAQLYKLSSAEISRARTGLSEDLERFSRACYFTEALELGLREGDPNPKAYLAADAAFNLIEKESRPKELDWLVRFFDVKFLSHIGYRPELERCVVCRAAAAEGVSAAFDAERGGILCPACRAKGKNLIPLSAGAAKFLARIMATEFGGATRLKPSPAMLEEIGKAIVAFRNGRLRSIMKSERFFSTGVI